MAGLEIQTGKVPGTEVRRTPAPRPAFIGFLIVALAVIELVFVALVFTAIANHANNAAAHDPRIPNGTINIYFQHIQFFKNEQTIISFWISMATFCIHLSSAGLSRMQTPAGFPEKGLSVKASI